MFVLSPVLIGRLMVPECGRVFRTMSSLSHHFVENSKPTYSVSVFVRTFQTLFRHSVCNAIVSLSIIIFFKPSIDMFPREFKN